MTENKIIIGYWDCRGLIHPIKLVLEYLRLPYEFRAHTTGVPPNFDKSDWMSKKHEILAGFDFPNLPYLHDGEFKLTQSNAIMQYLGRRYGLGPDPASEHQVIDADIMREELMDYGLRITLVCYNPKLNQAAKDNFVNLTVPKLEDFQRKLEKSGGIWFLGDKLTFIDFLAYELFDQSRLLFPGILDNFQQLVGFMNRFESLEPIQAYLKSDRFRAYPIWSERSSFGRTPEDMKF